MFYSCLQGQSMVVEGNEWSVRDFGLFSPTVQTRLFRIQEEETFNDIVYRTVYATSDTTGMNWRKVDLLREDSLGRVYTPDGDGEQLLYDFSLEVNDTIRINSPYSFGCPLYVQSIDTIELFNGEKRKKFNFGDPYGFNYSWIEGIGASHGPLFNLYCALDISTFTACFSNSEEMLFSAFDDDCFIETSVSNVLPSDVNVFPKPFSDELHITSSVTNIQSYKIFDLHGRLVKEGNNAYDVIDMSSISTGAFIILLEARDGNVYSDKLIKLD